ncbi:MAG: Eco57I restriction-modification methylase domain-containing protein [Sedimentisphaerales bacterium]|nr:Eco57I restriction-modification methylase domain-containing protein [Sedimentisphaerales bacterium]
MEKRQAAELIKTTFEKAFSEEQLLKLLINVFNDFDSSKTMGPWQGNRVFQPFRDHISSFKRIGQYRDPQGTVLDVLTVKVSQGTKLERARTTLRNLAIEYLKGRNAISEYRDTVLVAFYADDTKDWRLSFIKLETISYRNDEGKIKTKNQITSARRYSFLVGENEPSHTAQQQFVPLLQDTFNNPTLSQLEEAFNIEKVTKEFFTKYKELFHKVQEHLEDLLKKDKTIREDFESKSIETSAFAKKLLGQIVFLYFIQKKGWLGVPKEKNFGEGDKSFLRSLFKKATTEGKNYFNDYLEFLFYEALAIERKSADPSWYKPFNCRIPFLNGGLFEPIADYDWENTEIVIPNDIFSNTEVNKEGDIGTGVLDVFDRYNFTVKEDEPLEKEVAVDPEMLGKVFENLLEVKDRKSKGTYYTPREIVHYMCQESLINYLDTTINGQKGSFLAIGDNQYDMFGNKKRTGQLKLEESSTKIIIPREDIEDFIKHSHLIVNDTRQEKKSWQLPDSIQNDADVFDEALEKIKICDPAIGSGAFPVGLLTEIVNARQALTQFMSKSESNPNRTPYHLKRDCIHNSIYGVDIDPSAIDVAKLRLWLSLVVEEESITEVEALPNLDYKIVCGNSLLGYGYRPSGLDKIEELKNDFFDETNNTEKRKLKQNIDSAIEKQFAGTEKSLGFKLSFDFQVNFSEIWHDQKGFDIVIGNPPYVNIVNLEKKFRTIYKKIFSITKNKVDLYAYFIVKGLQLLKPNAILSYIVSHTWKATTSFEKLRKVIFSNYKLLKIVDLNFGVFEATVKPVVVLIQNTTHNDYTIKVYNDEFVQVNTVDVREVLLEQEYSLDTLNIPKEKELFKKIELNSIPLSEIIRFSRGIKTSNDNKFILNNPKDKDCKPVYRGKNIKAFQLNWTGEYVWYRPDLMREKTGCLPHSVEFFEVPFKLVTQRVNSSMQLLVAYDKCGNYFLDTTNVSNYSTWDKKTSMKYLCGLMNSNVINFYYCKKYRMPTIGGYELHSVPIKKTDFKTQSLFDLVVDYILWLKNSDYNNNTWPPYFEQIVNSMVYELYFEEELKNANRDVLKYLTDLKPISDDMTDQQKLEIIESEFNRLYDKIHPVRNNLFYMDSIPEIRIIKGLDKDENN